MGVREYDYIRGNTALAQDKKVKNKEKNKGYKVKKEKGQ